MPPALDGQQRSFLFTYRIRRTGWLTEIRVAIAGNARVLVYENAHPEPSHRIRPLLTVKLPGMKTEAMTCSNVISPDPALVFP